VPNCHVGKTLAWTVQNPLQDLESETHRVSAFASVSRRAPIGSILARLLTQSVAEVPLKSAASTLSCQFDINSRQASAPRRCARTLLVASKASRAHLSQRPSRSAKPS
jgi:hypothetical protein